MNHDRRRGGCLTCRAMTHIIETAKGWRMGKLAVVAGATLLCVGTGSVLLGPGCVIQLGQGSNSETQLEPTGGRGGSGGGASGAGGAVGDAQAEAAFAALDPQELALASVKGSATSYYLMGTIAAMNLDLATVDEATMNSLMEQNAPLAEAVVNNWLASVDPSTLTPVNAKPRFECSLDPFDCLDRTTCLCPPFYSTIKHVCYVEDCGISQCSSCPDWFPDILKSPLVRSWCAYVCIEEGVTYPKVVAVGAGGIVAGIFSGPFCFSP